MDTTETFTLWNPVIDVLSRECYFDVRPQAFVQIHAGSAKLISEFLRNLSLVGEVANWNIERFCSPYFAGASASDSYIDRYPLAWHIKVRFSGEIKNNLTDKDILGPHPSGGIDPTWRETENSWIWSQCRCLVIADIPSTKWKNVFKDLDFMTVFSLCRGIEICQLSPSIIQTRFSLGMLRFPDDSRKVEMILDACKQIHASVNWATSLRNSLG